MRKLLKENVKAFSKQKSLIDRLIENHNMQYQMRLIETYFKDDVPIVCGTPDLIEYGFVQNVENEVKRESKKIEDKWNIIATSIICLVSIIYVFILINFSIRNDFPIWAALILGGWPIPTVAFFIYAFFSRLEDIEKANNELILRYKKYRDHYIAFEYWKTIKLSVLWNNMDDKSYLNAVMDMLSLYGDIVLNEELGGEHIDFTFKDNDGFTKGVKCLFNNTKANISEVRAFADKVKLYGYDGGILISRCGYSANAQDYADSNNISLMDRDKMLNILSDRFWNRM